ncbi:MAG: WGR domain-containing protein, partial [Verrucomicrobiota bacterium]
MEKRELVYMDAKSKKFWNIELDGTSHTVKYGRIGTDGQSSTKDFPSEDKARASMEKLVKQKLSKGYVDAEGAGASAGGVEESDGAIPLIAFNSIVHREHIFDNASTFVGQRVIDYDPEKKAKSDVAYRFRSDWDEDNLMPHLEHFLETDAALKATAVVIGNWSGDDPDVGSDAVVAKLVEKKDRLPNLAAIYVGDITQEENEISWIHQSDLSPILEAFPQLQFLRSRGGESLELKKP